ncbi:type II toxin-antitoxin system prevent-host-death family antitoxin [bacterium]|nr:type II toxin-antitoxin system prevent-host-death family antitoxin [bacterium]MCI0602439.1 type II toxin-antitoxin system prevent-host-death family antitoxin [bacterium]
MKSVTAKELKNRTGEVLKLIEDGQKVLITMRSKPFAVLSPVQDRQLEAAHLRAYEEAWDDIETTLRRTKPRFGSVAEAMRWSRRRS